MADEHQDFEHQDFEQIAQVYYTNPKLYPCAALWSLLSALGGTCTANATREFAFTTLDTVPSAHPQPAGPGVARITRLLRYIRCPRSTGYVEMLARKRPIRVDVGAVYAGAPHTQKVLASTADLRPNLPIGRELVFDVDIDAYDDPGSRRPHLQQARGCCRGRMYCSACWPLVTSAARTICDRIAQHCGVAASASDAASTVTPGVFFSGGRGIHIWTFATCSSDPTFVSPDRTVRAALRTTLVPQGPPGAIVDRAIRDPQLYAVLHMLLGARGVVPGGAVLAANAPHRRTFLSWYMGMHPAEALAALWVAIDAAKTAVAAVAAESSSLSPNVSAAVHTLSQHVDAAVRQMAECSHEFTNDPRRREDGVTESSKWPRVCRLARMLENIRHDIHSAFARAGTPYVAETREQWRRDVTGIALEAAVACMWPRLDEAPSDAPEHMLRAPMGINTTSGYIGMYVKPCDIDTFVPHVHAPRVVKSERDAATGAVALTFFPELKPRLLDFTGFVSHVGWLRDKARKQRDDAQIEDVTSCGVIM